MPNIRTLIQLQETLDSEMGWRVKEIGAFIVASKSGSPEKKFFIRAGVALVYAHWEGFIKASSEQYLSFVHYRGHTYRELKSCFAVFGLKSKLQMLSKSRQSSPNIEAFDFIISEMGQPAHMQMASAIDTESNLTSKVFTNIAASLDLNVEKYKTKFNLIDESLVKRRNQVAHGEYMDLGGREFGELVDEILQLMRDYKTDLLNAASIEAYKRPIPLVN
ncbi:MAE_28990/MAE_18760 family HEPN-like nuclease [Pseudomonas sp. BIC9C]|uniref:MAE_28990/MAE_18760 family HEPN-like nuclease n=1 Tax=Pseudomonas sp. BIC9C TaxID=3078458 RepID=UPI002AD3A72F|nr:MAE_28990/MAE_18760 family HEPN-like nuclease [Pseudomonas sp. BIC9C]